MKEKDALTTTEYMGIGRVFTVEQTTDMVANLANSDLK